MSDTQTHYKLNGIGLCANRRRMKMTTDRRLTTCKACLKKLTKIYERVLRGG